MKKSSIVSTILLLTLLLINLNAQNEFNKNKLNDYLDQLEKNNKAMLGVALTKDGKLIYENYIGLSSVKDNIPNSNLIKFRIGSITKMFTATIIFQLIEEGRLTLDTKLSKFYPKIPNSKEITISDLLSHRSGIHNFTSDEDYLQYMTFKKSKEEMLELITNLKPDFQPNEKAVYSNSNYLLLGYIIEEITNSPYQQELQKRITTKLNLLDTYYGNKIDTKKNEAFSYKFYEGEWHVQPETDTSIPHGAGAIVSTPKDLTVFITSLFTKKLISDSSLDQMKEIKDGYGRGFLRFPFGNNFAYGYNGGIDGFVSNLAYFPNEKVALAVLANGINYNFNDILIGILIIFFNVPFEIPDLAAKEIVLEMKELKKYEGEFSSELLPLKITLKVEGDILYGQATGQSAFPLTPFSKTEFRFEKAGIVIEFSKDNEGKVQYSTFILKQGGGNFPYIRE